MTSPDMVNDGTVEVNRIGARFGSKAIGGWRAINDDKIPLRELSFSVELGHRNSILG